VTQSHLSKACSALSGDLRAATGNRALFKSTGVSFKQQIYQAILIQILFAISCCPTTIARCQVVVSEQLVLPTLQHSRNHSCK
jgi:hypothetical protein